MCISNGIYRNNRHVHTEQQHPSKSYRKFIRRYEEVTGELEDPPKAISDFLSSFFLTGVEHSLKSSTRASACRIN
jgi:hypothetical protein